MNQMKCPHSSKTWNWNEGEGRKIRYIMYQEFPAALDMMSKRTRGSRPAPTPNTIASAAAQRWIPHSKSLTNFSLLHCETKGKAFSWTYNCTCYQLFCNQKKREKPYCFAFHTCWTFCLPNCINFMHTKKDQNRRRKIPAQTWCAIFGDVTHGCQQRKWQQSDVNFSITQY